MAQFNYVSCIKIKGMPILPPLLTPEDRLEMRRYKELAVQKEKEFAQNQQAREVQHHLSEDEADLSLNTEQVVEFVRQALPPDMLKNLEEVKMLQSVIIRELERQDDDDDDTLGDIDDLSPLDRRLFSDQSKSTEESFSEPKTEDDFGEISPIKKPEESLAEDDGRHTPPKLIRTNSYTLSHPSPSVWAYFKSVTMSDNSILSDALDNLSLSWDGHVDKTPSPTQLSPDKRSSNFLYQNINNNVELKADKAIESNHTKDNTITPKMETAAVKIQAGIRGYLVRRLMKTMKVTELKNTIKDSLVTALQLYSEPAPNRAEVELHKRLASQIGNICHEWHTIFFDLTPQERMKIIQVDRNRALLAKKPKPVVKRVVKLVPKKTT